MASRCLTHYFRDAVFLCLSWLCIRLFVQIFRSLSDSSLAYCILTFFFSILSSARFFLPSALQAARTIPWKFAEDDAVVIEAKQLQAAGGPMAGARLAGLLVGARGLMSSTRFARDLAECRR